MVTSRFRRRASVVACLSGCIATFIGALAASACTPFAAADSDPTVDGGVPDAGLLDAELPTAPIEIAALSGQTLGAVFAAGTAGVVWSANLEIFGLAATGKPVVMYVGGEVLSKDAVVTSGDVIVSRLSSGAVIRCPYGVSCTSIPGNTATGFNRPGPLSLDGATLYVAETNGAMRLMTCSAAPCKTSTAQFGSAALPSGVTSIAAAGGNVMVVVTTGQITAYASSGGPTALQDAAGTVAGIANDGLYAYWVDGVSKRLVSRDVGAVGPPTASPFMVANAVGFVRDGDRLYWLEPSTGEVRRCKTKAFAGVEVVAVLPGASRLAVGDRIYLANDTTGKIYAAPKKP